MNYNSFFKTNFSPGENVFIGLQQGWTVTKYNYLNAVLKYVFGVSVLYLSVIFVNIWFLLYVKDKYSIVIFDFIFLLRLLLLAT